MPDTLFCIPTLGRRPDFLEQTLRSVAEQRVPLRLVVVAPEGRVDPELLQRHGAELVPDPGGGISAALNAALAASAGEEFFTWLGDDDLLRPGSLEATREVLRADPGASMVYGWCDYIDADGNVVFSSRAGRLARRILRFGPNLVPQPGSLMRLADVIAAGGLDESLALALDLDLYLRLRQRGRILNIDATVACFRWHAGSSTVGNPSASMEESDQVRMRYMGRIAAGIYQYLRWPGRAVLWWAKRRVDRRATSSAPVL